MEVIEKPLTDTDLLKMFEQCEKLPQIEIPLKHYFSDGVYIREVIMPKNSFIVGKIHKTKHMNIVQQGKCLVWMNGEVHNIEAPYTFESEAGTQKILKIIEDTVWTTIHATEETDIDTLEESLATTSLEEKNHIKELLCQ